MFHKVVLRTPIIPSIKLVHDGKLYNTTTLCMRRSRAAKKTRRQPCGSKEHVLLPELSKFKLEFLRHHLGLS